MRRLHPASLSQAQPDNVQWEWADSVTGQRSAEGCPNVLSVPFRSDTIPQSLSPCAQGELPGAIDGVNNALKKVIDWF